MLPIWRLPCHLAMHAYQQAGCLPNRHVRGPGANGICPRPHGAHAERKRLEKARGGTMAGEILLVFSKLKDDMIGAADCLYLPSSDVHRPPYVMFISAFAHPSICFSSIE